MKTSLIRCAVVAFALGSAAALAADLVKSDGFPSRTISIIVPYGAGSGSDQVSRAWGEAMKDVTGVGFQVENKPGGAGLAAMPDFMSRPADGCTIVEQTAEDAARLIADTVEIYRASYKKLGLIK